MDVFQRSFFYLFFSTFLIAFKDAVIENESNKLSKTFPKLREVADFSIYYNLRSNKTIRDMMPRPWYFPGWPLRLPFVGEPCSCAGAACGCCAGMRIDALHFDRKTCANFSYSAESFEIIMNVTMNGKPILSNRFSAKNPPPFCIPAPIPYLPPGLVDFCIRVFDVYTTGPNMHMCVDFDTRVDKAPVLVLHFDCIKMGLDGVSLAKPNQTDSTTTSITVTSDATPNDNEQLASDIFDEVTEIRN